MAPWQRRGGSAMSYVGAMEPTDADHGYEDEPTLSSAPGEGRTWLIVLSAVATELVIILATANQWLSDRIIDDLGSGSQGGQLLESSWLTYTWRFAPRAGQGDVWASEVALVLTLLLLSAWLIYAVVRGRVTFGRAFVGTWMAVLVASLVGAFVRGLIDPRSKYQLPQSNRLTRAVFSGFGPGQQVVVAAFFLGLVVALLAATVAVTTRESTLADSPPTGSGSYPDAGTYPAAGSAAYPATEPGPYPAPPTSYAPPPPPPWAG